MTGIQMGRMESEHGWLSPPSRPRQVRERSPFSVSQRRGQLGRKSNWKGVESILELPRQERVLSA